MGENGDKKFLAAGIKPRIVELLKNGKEEAMFSKMLATIRRDAPIDFELPVKKWREDFDFSKIEALFMELEFRTLGARVKAVVEGKEEGKVQKVKGKSDENDQDNDKEVRQEQGRREETFSEGSLGA